jgi:hypothetical protein
MNVKRRDEGDVERSGVRAPGSGIEDSHAAGGPPPWFQPESGTEADGEQAEGTRDRDADEV